VIDLAVERPISAAAYRIVQEALTNAMKHAGPARIEVSLVCDADDLVVSVVDDGRGAASNTHQDGGRGIAGMTERASVLGGRLVAGPRVGGGFRVEARLPRSKEHA
jgi:signal transduction histidine kinase